MTGERITSFEQYSSDATLAPYRVMEPRSVIHPLDPDLPELQEQLVIPMSFSSKGVKYLDDLCYCPYCGAEGCTIDHVIPKIAAKIDPALFSNIKEQRFNKVSLCRPCHEEVDRKKIPHSRYVGPIRIIYMIADYPRCEDPILREIQRKQWIELFLNMYEEYRFVHRPVSTLTSAECRKAADNVILPYINVWRNENF